MPKDLVVCLMGHPARGGAVARAQPSHILRLAPSPLTGRMHEIQSYARLADAVRAHKAHDDGALLCLFPSAIRAAARRFLASFPGQVTYAMKSNPHPIVLHLLYQEGVRHFDAASWPEIELVRSLGPHAVAHFMNPVKARAVIARAWRAGVRSFALDCEAELDKIVAMTDGARDLTLLVRLAWTDGDARMPLDGKFGACAADAPRLLRAARKASARLGFTFHLGSQAMRPRAFAHLFAHSRALIQASGVVPDFLDIGGGFPLRYPGMVPPPLPAYMAEIRRAAKRYGFAATPLWCEPGRALVGEGGATAARVELRKGDALYLNEGIYGSLFDAGAPRWRFPVARVGDGARKRTPMRAFTLFGPTCDSADRLHHDVRLPADMREGDWLEFGQLGAYGQVMKTGFNGFGSHRMALIDEPPLLARRAAPAAGA